MTIDRRTMMAGALGTAAVALVAPGLASAAPLRQRRTVFGVNCYDLFYRAVNGRGFKDPLPVLQPLGDNGIRFVRYNAGFFWPDQWRAFDSDRARFMGMMDQIVAAAEKARVGLVPSMIWAAGSVSDYCGEPLSAWGDTGSKSWAFAERYIRELVTRYRASPAIWFWEFGNEFNAFANFVGSEKYVPLIDVKHGTPAIRTPADRIDTQDVATVFGHFAEIVRDLDDTRPISSGGDLPRSRMMNAARGLKALDSLTQFGSALDVSLTGPTDMLSVHLYDKSLKDRFVPAGTSYAQILSGVRRAADSRRAGVFVGEFGLPATAPDASPAAFDRTVSAIRDGRADYAALWNYDYWPKDPFTVTFDNDRAWQLKALGKANA